MRVLKFSVSGSCKKDIRRQFININERKCLSCQSWWSFLSKDCWNEKDFCLQEISRKTYFQEFFLPNKILIHDSSRLKSFIQNSLNSVRRDEKAVEGIVNVEMKRGENYSPNNVTKYWLNFKNLADTHFGIINLENQCTNLHHLESRLATLVERQNHKMTSASATAAWCASKNRHWYRKNWKS